MRSGLILIIVGIYVPFIVASVFLVLNLNQEEQKRLQESNRAYAQSLSYSLDSNFKIIQSSLLALRNSPALNSNNLPAFYEQASTLSKSNDLTSVVLSDRSAKVIFSTARPYGTQFPLISNLNSVEEYFNRAGAGPFVSNLFIGPVVKDWLAVVRVPVFDATGQMKYILSATYPVNRLNQFLEQQQSNTDQIIAIIDPSGKIAARSRLPKKFIGSEIRPLFKAAIDSTPTGFFEGPNLENIPVSIAYHQSPETKWTVYIATPIAIINSQALSNLQLYIGFIVASLVLGLIFGWWVSSKITFTISELIPRSRQLGSGKEASPLLSPIKEVNDVAASIQQASKLLSERQKSLIDLNAALESKVAERTKEMDDLYNKAPCGYYSIDANGIFVRINDTELEWLGCSRDEVIGRMRFFDLLNEAGRMLFQKSFPKFIADGYIENLEFEITGKNGQSKVVSISATALKDEQGNLIMTRSVMYDITERKRLEVQINQMAYYDALTRLPNRRLLLDRLSQGLQTIKRGGLYGALMFIDLDNFKLLNDLHGHELGDSLLIEAGSRIKACLREMDTVARIGGDEFVVFIGQFEGDEIKALTQARMVAEKIRLVLAEPYQLITLNDEKSGVVIEHQCFSSIGVVVFSDKAGDMDVILKAADTMMYEAKNLGRNQVRVNPVVI